MIKKQRNSSASAVFNRFVRIMKLINLCLILGVCIVNATNSYSQSTLLSLDMKNNTLEEVFEMIEKNSEYVFFYTDKAVDLKKKVNIQVKDQTIEKVLDKLLKQTGNDYAIDDRQVFIGVKKDVIVPMVFQQDLVRVTGMVKDDTGETLPGVAVQIVGSPRGVTTDIDGSFSIEVKTTDKLLFSYLGMEPQTITVGNQRTIMVTLKAKTDELEEVTIVAFAKQKKESVLASITTVKPSELKVPSSNLTTALAGRIAGVISYQRSGEPGQDNADFFVRGVTTFGAGKADPLILIDGVEFTYQDLARLNVDDIASFSIMKDANATALYGARGANGVILVTTKEGTEGKARLSFRYETSLSTPTNKVKLANPIDYMLLHNEAVRTRDPLGVLPYSNKKIAMTGVGNPNVYPATDWYDLLMTDNTINHRANISISGGGEIARYYVAASFSQDNGNLRMDKRNNFNNNIDLKKYLLRSNVNINLTKTTEMIVRMHGTFDDYSGPLEGGTGVYNKIMRTNPVLFPAFYSPDKGNALTQHILFGNSDGGKFINPYADMVKGYKESSNTQVLAQLELKQNFDFLLKGLSARILFNTSRYSESDVSRSYNPFYYDVIYYDQVEDEYLLRKLNPLDGSEWLSYSEGNKKVSSTTYFEGALQYNNQFADLHSVSALMVFTTRESRISNAGSLQASLPFRNVGLAGRATYAYDNKYFAEFNFGYNGSERFSQKERYGFFPSAGVGYIISNESFFEPLSKYISKLKLKATYGMVGNDEIGEAADRFFFLSNVTLNNGNRGYNFGTDFGYNRPGVSISRYEDPYITWETAYKQNYGFELNLFDKLEIQGDVFFENRENILQKRSSIPSSMGLQASPNSNVGKSSGMGYDMSVDYSQSFNKDFWLSVRGNFTYATSKYELYEEPDYINTPWRRRYGQRLSQQFGYIAERLFVDEDDVRNSPKQQFGEYMAGDIKYKDINLDGLIDEDDQVPIGYPTSPEIIYGFGFSLGYKGLDLSAFFQGSARSSFWIDPRSISPFVDTDNNASIVSQNALLQVIADDHWSENNRNAYAFWPRLSDRLIENNMQASTWYMRDGTFLRLKSVELGYTLPKKWSQKMHLDVLRLYVSGTNLFCLSNFKLWDVEMAGNGLGYPIQRVFNVGININL